MLSMFIVECKASKKLEETLCFILLERKMHALHVCEIELKRGQNLW